MVGEGVSRSSGLAETHSLTSTLRPAIASRAAASCFQPGVVSYRHTLCFRLQVATKSGKTTPQQLRLEHSEPALTRRALSFWEAHMASRPAPTIADNLERLAREVHALAFDFTEPARSVRDAEGRIARAEDIAAELRAIVRGRTNG